MLLWLFFHASIEFCVEVKIGLYIGNVAAENQLLSVDFSLEINNWPHLEMCTQIITESIGYGVEPTT